MSNLSERVQREFDLWKDKYEIPSHMEFEVKTLLKLQEEYDLVEVGSNTTKTRESLLGMINRLHMNMRLNEKNKKIMYVDYYRNDEHGIDKILVYIDDNMYIIQGSSDKNINYYVNVIKSIAEKEKAVVCIDVQGFGMAIFDGLVQYENIVVRKLRHIRQ